MTELNHDPCHGTTAGTVEPAIDEKIYNEECCCNSMSIISINGIRVCTNCGMERGVDIVGSLPRYYTKDEKNRRLHNEPVLPVFLGTPLRMPINTVDIPSIKRWKLMRMARVDTQRNSRNREYLNYFKEFKEMSIKIGVPLFVVHTSLLIMKKMRKKTSFRGLRIKILLKAIFFHACRVHGFQVYLNEIYTEPGEMKGFMNYCRIINKYSGIKVKKPSMGGYLTRAAAILNVDVKVTFLSMKIWKNMIKNGFGTGKSPLTVSGAILFVACKARGFAVKGMIPTQSLVSDILGITTVSLRNLTKEVIMYCNLPVICEFKVARHARVKK
jgi:transcription initiation factor TFIIIB Brf1 subunit/transcription initiation factor TFIIB